VSLAGHLADGALSPTTEAQGSGDSDAKRSSKGYFMQAQQMGRGARAGYLRAAARTALATWLEVRTGQGEGKRPEGQQKFRFRTSTEPEGPLPEQNPWWR